MKPLINFVGVQPSDAFGSGFKLWLAFKERGSTQVPIIAGMTDVLQGSEVPEPVAMLDAEGAQRLMDQLYGLGVRPTEAAGSAGATAAVQAHLKDLQRLVFKGKP